jgi:ABC-type sugar transport system ATPase subunit
MRSEFKLIHKQIQEEGGGPFIYVTHDQVEALTLGTKVAVINHGKLEQLDEPDHLYNCPQNIFTAKFIGSPEMNLIEGKLIQKGGGWVFKHQDQQILVEPDEESVPREGEVILGVRPEDICISKQDNGGFSARVLTTELLGQNYLVLMEVDEELTISALSKLEEDISDGDQVDVTIASGKAHVFDPQTEKRM